MTTVILQVRLDIFLENGWNKSMMTSVEFFSVTCQKSTKSTYTCPPQNGLIVVFVVLQIAGSGVIKWVILLPAQTMHFSKGVASKLQIYMFALLDPPKKGNFMTPVALAANKSLANASGAG